MNKKLFFLFIGFYLLIFLIHVFVTHLFTVNFFQTLNFRREESRKVHQYEQYLSYLKDAEIGQRGFILTGDPNYLESYHDAVTQLNSPLFENFFQEELQNPNHELVEKVKQIERLKQKELNELIKSIAAKQQGIEGVQSIELTKGKQIMDEIRYLIRSIIESKQRNVNELDQKIPQKMQETIHFISLSDLIASILFGVCLYYLYRALQKLRKKDEELSTTLQRLHKSLAFEEAILNSAHYAIISANSDGIITSFNSAAEQMLGYKKEELVGKSTPLIFHDVEERESRAIELSKKLGRKVLPTFEVFIALAKEGGADTNEWTYVRKDGSRFPVQLSVTAIRNLQGDIIGYVGMASDITERKEIDQMKNELIALASYELRSPVVSIKGAFDLLFQPEFNLSEQAKKILDLGQQSCSRLVRLTENLLDIQKIEAGKEFFHFKRISISDFLSQAIRANTLEADSAHVTLECDPVLPEWVFEGDEDRLMQVMSHLLSNAIKYSPFNGKVKVSAQRIHSKIRFEVKDQGPGIPKEFQSKVFQKFVRDTSLANAEKKGSGLGLNISRSIIEKHNGTIGFKTSPKGSIFWFELPALEL